MKPDNMFGNIISSKGYDNFLDNPEDLARPDLIRCKNLYKSIIEQNTSSLEFLAKLEETIIQIRCQERVFNDIKLSEVRGYIYARAPFYKLGSKKKDIRVVVGKTIDHGEDLNVLLKDVQFIKNARKKLVGQMSLEITGNLMDVEEFEESLKVTI